MWSVFFFFFKDKQPWRLRQRTVTAPAPFQKFCGMCARSRLNSALGVMNRKTRDTPMPPHLHGQGHGAFKIYMEMGNKFKPSVHADTLQ